MANIAHDGSKNWKAYNSGPIDWAHVPKQSEVEDRIYDSRNGYVSFALCTPTSIMPAHGYGGSSRSPWYGRGL